MRVGPMTSLRLGPHPPGETTLQAYAVRSGAAGREFNHAFMPGGAQPESRLRLIELSSELGRGSGCYQRASRLLLDWEMHGGSDSTGVWTDGGALVTWAALAPGLFVLNPCRVLSAKCDRRSSTVGYATTRGHLIAGCEEMTVRHCADGTVRFELRSLSRGSGLLGRAIFPMLAPAQDRFFGEQLRCMRAQLKIAK